VGEVKTSYNDTNTYGGRRIGATLRGAEVPELEKQAASRLDNARGLGGTLNGEKLILL